MKIKADNLNLTLQDRHILTHIDFEVRAQKTLGLLGPNGSGKSTLIRCLAGLEPLVRPAVLLDEQRLDDITRGELARCIAFVPQHSNSDIPLTVREIIRMGRTPHRGRFQHWSVEDESAVEEAIWLTNMHELAERSWGRLSGGERQRCQIARALAQKPQVLLLDEPTNHLDIQHQLELMSLIHSLPVTVVVALHDLNLAANFCDKLLVLREGAVVATGSPTEILTTPLIKSVWRVDALVTHQRQMNIQYHCPKTINVGSELKAGQSYAA